MGPGETALSIIEDLPVTGEEICPYLPAQLARYRAFAAAHVPPALYHELMNQRFRRSGEYFYQPACRACNACIPIRVPVATFQPSRSQRRAEKRNQDLSIEAHPPSFSDEKYALYERYSAQWHGKAKVSPLDFADFLTDSPVDTLEFHYRDTAGRLLAVGVCDACPLSLSSVYFYFEPAEHRRSLGTFGALAEIAWARQRGIPHYYLGYWVSGSATMDYKSRFRPHELLRDGHWQPGG